MRTLLLLLILTTAASAQQDPAKPLQIPQVVPLPSSGPKTVPMVNLNNEKIGTATMTGNTVYFRDADGTLLASMVVDKDGARTLYDANGRELRHMDGNDPRLKQ
jgi:hypothetical protein